MRKFFTITLNDGTVLPIKFRKLSETNRPPTAKQWSKIATYNPAQKYALTKHLYLKQTVINNLYREIIASNLINACFWANELCESGLQMCLREALWELYLYYFAVFDLDFSNSIKTQDLVIVTEKLCYMPHNGEIYNAILFKKSSNPLKQEIINRCDYKEGLKKIGCELTNKRWKLTPKSRRMELLQIFSVAPESEGVTSSLLSLSEIVPHDIEEKWLYYASFSPFWRNKILQKRGWWINDDTQTVELATEEMQRKMCGNCNMNYEIELDEESELNLAHLLEATKVA